MRITLLILSICCSALISSGQTEIQDTNRLIQFSGLVVTSDSLTPVSFTHVKIKGTGKGAIADYYGFFSMVTKTSDTIVFSSVGFAPTEFIIPDTLKESSYSLFQVMATDTIYLTETVIYPWATYKQFTEAFFNLEIPEDDIERAKKNLALAELKEELIGTEAISSINYRDFVNENHYNMSYYGQYKPSLTSSINNPLLNPIAWAKFFQAWKNGEFKIER